MSAAAAPPWLRQLASNPAADPHGINQVLNRSGPAGRAASVLILFGGQNIAAVPGDATVLLTQRARTLRQHGGQVSFPGGAAEPTDTSPAATALRESAEETGLDPSGVDILAVLDPVYVPPSRFHVTPVLGYWRQPSPVTVVDPAEVERVAQVPVASLLNPANRFVVRHPLGYQGPAFAVDGMIVWGLTGGLLAGLFAVSGWEIPWDHTDVRDLATTLAAAGQQ